MMKLNH